MSRMIPPICPPGNTSPAEVCLFDALSSGLDRHYTVIHSLPWLAADQRRLREGECDFLVLHPEFGMLAIEAKSGEISYDGSRRTWTRGDGVEIKDPFQQAQSSVHYLNGLLSRRVRAWSEAGLPFGHAVAFPNADRFTGNLPPHAKLQLLILAPDLDVLQTRIEAMLSAWGSRARSMSGTEMQSVIDVLLPHFHVSVPLSSRIRDQEAALFRLTERQIDFLEAARVNRRMVLEGCAGSGKTVLAVEIAARLAEEGERVLLLCFNIPLREELARRAGERGGVIDVHHFHGLCESIVRSARPDWRPPADQTTHYWEHDLPQLLLDSIDGSTPRYDAIVVDEAQDFSELWWTPLDQLFSSGESRLYVFRDQNQNVYGRRNELPYEGLAQFRLPHNCRNTVEIAKVAFGFAGLDLPSFPDPVQGTEPEFIDVANDHEERDQIRKRIHELVNVGGLRTDQIVILGNRRFQNSVFADQPRLGRFEIIGSPDPGNETQVRYETVYRFKGLDADCVILTGMDAVEPEEMEATERALWYVGASRGRMLLYVVRRLD